MKRLLQLIRLLHINYVLLRHRVDRVVLSVGPLQPFHFLSYLNPWNWFGTKGRPRGEAVRLALEQLGPIFVKFGQILSTRRDLLPEDVADELEKLQDQVPPFSGVIAKQIIETTYGKPVTELFAEFNLTPLASASIAQIHAATLPDGRQVVVKIVRPNIHKVIRRDIGLLQSVATLTERILPYGWRLRPREVVAEFERSILNELDLMHEGANASQLRRNFLDSNLLYIPEVCWDYARSNILVMERIDGIPISDVAALKRCGVNLKRLAEKGVEIFFTQVLRDSFFHADMHPGNIFVSTQNPEDPLYLAVDFGIMGTLSPIDQRYLAENLLAFFRRDYRKVAKLHVESGWVEHDVRVDEFEAAIRGVCEPIFERPLRDISFGKLLLRLFQTAGHFHMEIQPQLVLLQKTLVNIEGLGRQLYPELDLWSTAKPFLERWIKERFSPKTILKKIYEQGPYLLEKAVEIPGLLHTVLSAQKDIYLEKQTQMRKKLRQKQGSSTAKFWAGLGLGLVAVSGINYFFIDVQNKHSLIFDVSLGVVGILVFLLSLIVRWRES
jgi:ubiquinone biosynthesis protein